jgi:hypothetical protein
MLPLGFGRVERLHEVVQYAKIEAHTDLVEHGPEPGVEGFAVLGHDQSGPDGAQVLLWLGHVSWSEVLWLCGHPGLPFTLQSLQSPVGTARGNLLAIAVSDHRMTV